MNDLAEKNKQLNTKEKIEKKEVLHSFPIRISMNMTGKCNIRCIYCHLTYNDYYLGNQEMDLSTFKKLTPFLKHVSHLVYFSSTEPLAAKYFKSNFKYSIDFETEKYLSTNGLLIDDETSEIFCSKGGLDFLTISLAGTTNAEFKKYHQIDGLNTLIHNINHINLKARKSGFGPRKRLVYVLLRDNAPMLVDAIDFAKNYHFEEGIKINYLMAQDIRFVDLLPFKHRDEINYHVKKALEYADKIGVKVAFDGGSFLDYQDENINGLHRMCYEPFERMHIEANGSVKPCTNLYCSDIAGNINEHSLDEIWNGEVFRNYRKFVNTNTPPDACKRCMLNVHRDFNREDIWDMSDSTFFTYKRKK